MMTTYYDEYELVNYTKVEDKELNELFQDVRKTFNNKYFLKEMTIIEKKWFHKPKEIKLYMLLNRLNGMEFQIVNFCRDWNSSINTHVPKSYIHTLFCGLLNGYEYSKQQ